MVNKVKKVNEKNDITWFVAQLFFLKLVKCACRRKVNCAFV